jgi:hypothetical protein
MIRGAILFGCCVCLASPVSIQAQTEQEVMSPIHRLFDAMRTGDSTSARTAFHEDARLVRLPGAVEEFDVDETLLEGFMSSIGGDREDSWDEPIWDWEVRIDGNLASVWTKYAFYRNGEFSHCGVDAFLLADTPSGWKIVSLVYSRRQHDCELPPGR